MSGKTPLNLEDIEAIQPELVEHTPTFLIHNKVRGGLISTVSEKFPDGDAGGIASWLHAARTSLPPEKAVKQLIEKMLQQARKVAQEEGCPAPSTLDHVKFDDRTRIAGLLAPKYSIFESAYVFEDQLEKTLLAIERFEQNNTDHVSMSQFYQAMEQAILIAERQHVFLVKFYERQILSGAETNWNHGGAPRKEQQKAVRDIARLVAVDQFKKSEAIRLVIDRNKLDVDFDVKFDSAKKWVYTTHRDYYQYWHELYPRIN